MGRKKKVVEPDLVAVFGSTAEFKAKKRAGWVLIKRSFTLNDKKFSSVLELDSFKLKDAKNPEKFAYGLLKKNQPELFK